MRVVVNQGVTFLYPEENKKIKRVDGNSLFSIVALAKSDVKENYEEVDELWTPETEVTTNSLDIIDEINNIEPDSQGKISYEDAQKIINAVNIMAKRVVELENKVNQ